MISLDWNMALRSSVWCLSPSGVFGGFLFWVPLSLAATVQRGAGASSLHYVLQFLCLSCRFPLPLVFAAIQVVFPVGTPFFSKFLAGVCRTWQSSCWRCVAFWRPKSCCFVVVLDGAAPTSPCALWSSWDPVCSCRSASGSLSCPLWCLRLLTRLGV